MIDNINDYPGTSIIILSYNNLNNKLAKASIWYKTSIKYY